MSCTVLSILLASDPFASFRAGFGRFLAALFAVVLLVSLVATAVSVMKGDRDAALRAVRWVVVGAVGFSLLALLSNISF